MCLLWPDQIQSVCNGCNHSSALVTDKFWQNSDTKPMFLKSLLLCIASATPPPSFQVSDAQWFLFLLKMVPETGWLFPQTHNPKVLSPLPSLEFIFPLRILLVLLINSFSQSLHGLFRLNLLSLPVIVFLLPGDLLAGPSEWARWVLHGRQGEIQSKTFWGVGEMTFWLSVATEHVAA